MDVVPGLLEGSVMTTNKPEVFKVYRTKQGTLENVVLLADFESLQAECEKLRKEAERYNLLASMIVAESTGAVMTPQQEALFGALNTITHLRTADEVHAMFDAAIQEYNPCQT